MKAVISQSLKKILGNRTDRLQLQWAIERFRRGKDPTFTLENGETYKITLVPHP
jgi:hypothetical protein